MNDLRQRRVYLDAARIIAVLAVIMIHVSAPFVINWMRARDAFVVGNVFDSVSRFAVPMFLMVSGALMLDERKTITIGNALRRAGVLGLLLLFWSSFYEVALRLKNDRSFELYYLVRNILEGHYHLWYLYMVIGLYAVLPLLKTFVKRENRRYVLLFIGVSLVGDFLRPVLNALASMNNSLSFLPGFMDHFYLDYFGQGYAAYFLTGWYISEIGFERKWQRGLIYLLGLLSLAGILAYVFYTKDYDNGYANQNPLVFLYSVAVFLALKHAAPQTVAPAAQGRLVRCSRLTFGVYIIHELILTDVAPLLSFIGSPALQICAIFASVTALSFLFCWLVSKLPLIRRTIRM